jgi:hypothetical protein
MLAVPHLGYDCAGRPAASQLGRASEQTLSIHIRLRIHSMVRNGVHRQHFYDGDAALKLWLRRQARSFAAR